MSDSYRRRVQTLVDAIHLTAAALARLEWEARVASHMGWRAGGVPSTATWWPTPEPRGWPPIRLGTEREMMIPYFSPMVSQIPMIPGFGGPGLIHSGIGPISGGMAMQPMIPSGYRGPGMIPYGYGYGMGLLHSGPEMGMGIPGSGVGIPYGMGLPMQGMVPMHGLPPSMISPLPMMMSPMMQPAWSMGGSMPSPSPAPQM